MTKTLWGLVLKMGCFSASPDFPEWLSTELKDHEAERGPRSSSVLASCLPTGLTFVEIDAVKEIEPNLLLYVILVIVSLLSIRLRNGFDESETYKRRESVDDWVSLSQGKHYAFLHSFILMDCCGSKSMMAGNSEIRDTHSTWYGHLILRRKRGGQIYCPYVD